MFTYFLFFLFSLSLSLSLCFVVVEDLPLVELCTLYLHSCQVSYRKATQSFVVAFV